jgi:hypothetical protein
MPICTGKTNNNMGLKITQQHCAWMAEAFCLMHLAVENNQTQAFTQQKNKAAKG